MTLLLMIKLSAKNLFRNRRRSIYTGVTIAAGVLSLSLVYGYLTRTQLNLELSSVYLEHKGHLALMRPQAATFFLSRPRDYSLSDTDLSGIRKVLLEYQSQIDFLAPYLSGSGLISNGHISLPVVALGVDQGVFRRTYNNPLVEKYIPEWKGPATNQSFDLNSSDSISLTASLSQRLGDIKELQFSGLTYRGDFNAINVTQTAAHTTGNQSLDQNLIFANLAALQSLFDSTSVQYLAIYLKDGSKRARLHRELTTALEKAGLRLDIFQFDDEAWNSYYVGTMGFLTALGLFCSILIGVVSLLINLATSLMAVAERLREIGTLRSFGFKPIHVQLLFACECIMLNFFFGLIGAALAYPISGLINSSRLLYRPPGASIDVHFIVDPNLGMSATFIIMSSLACGLMSFLFSGRQICQPVDRLIRDTGG